MATRLNASSVSSDVTRAGAEQSRSLPSPTAPQSPRHHIWPATRLANSSGRATVLRQEASAILRHSRPLRIDEARAGRELLRRLTPYVESAANWWKAANAWLDVAISYAGLEALGVPRDSLQTFPEAFRVGMAARAPQLGDEGVNDPKNWEAPFGTREVHIGLSAFSDSEEKWRRVLAVAREQYESSSGISVLRTQDFGAQPGDRNSLGYKDGIDQPAIEGSGVDPLPGQGRPIKAGEFILGYPGEVGVRCRCRSRTSSVAMAPLSGSANISRASAPSIDSCTRTELPRKNRNCSPRSWSAVGAAALR